MKTPYNLVVLFTPYHVTCFLPMNFLTKPFKAKNQNPCAAYEVFPALRIFFRQALIEKPTNLEKTIFPFLIRRDAYTLFFHQMWNFQHCFLINCWEN